MANKRQKQIRRALRDEVRSANKQKRKTRAARKLAARVKRNNIEELAHEVGVSVAAYKILRQEADHATIRQNLLGHQAK